MSRIFEKYKWEKIDFEHFTRFFANQICKADRDFKLSALPG
jgi:hypothetical protein